MKRSHWGRRGSVLVFTLVLTAVAGIVVGTMCSYYTGSARIIQRLAQTRPHQVGKSALISVLDTLTPKLKAKAQGGTMDDVTAILKGTIPTGRTVSMGGYNVAFSYRDEISTKGTFTIIATVKDASGRVLATQSVLLNLSETTTATTTAPVFDYVYFANNYGHLESSSVVANGDVGANGPFSIAGATINGYIHAMKSVSLSSTPRIWDFKLYLKNVAEEYALNGTDYFAQVRPTNPLYKSAATYGVDGVTWPGGYEAPAPNPYTMNAGIGGYGLASSAWGKWELNYGGKAGPLGLEIKYPTSEYGQSINMPGSSYPSTSKLSYPIVRQNQTFVDMPDVSDVTKYRALCRSEGGTLRCQNRYGVGDDAGSKANITHTYKVKKKKKKQTQKMNGTCKVTTVEKRVFALGWVEDVTRRTVTTTGWSAGSTTTGGLEDDGTETITRTLSDINVSNGYNDNGVWPFSTRAADGAQTAYGDSYDNDKNNTALKAAEKDCAILIGTADFPIVIKGPVYFQGDVMIRGFVSGQGTIYSGRNIHILGDIIYLNPPSWPHSGSEKPDNVKKINENKDLLALVARGSVFAGNTSDSTWYSSCKTYLEGNGNYFSQGGAVCNTCDDSAIGYPAGNSFNHNYSVAETCGDRQMVEWQLSSTAYKTGSWSGTTEPSSKTYTLGSQISQTKTNGDRIGSVRTTVYNGTYNNQGQRTRYSYYREALVATTGNRKFYQSKLGPSTIADMVQTANASDPSWKWSTALQQRYFRTDGGQWKARSGTSNRQPLGLIATIVKDIRNWLVNDDWADGDITQIDGVVFANHGVFGLVAGSRASSFTLNGALLARDEGLLPTLNSRASKWYSDASVWLNWDMRIASSSEEHVKVVGIPKADTQTPSGVNISIGSWE